MSSPGEILAKAGTLWRPAAKAGPPTDGQEQDCARPNQGTGTSVGWTTNASFKFLNCCLAALLPESVSTPPPAANSTPAADSATVCVDVHSVQLTYTM